MAVNVIGQRMDFCALIHSSALLAVLSRRRRKAIGEVWPKYCCFTAGLMVLQYLLCIGIPPALCVGMEFLIISGISVKINYNLYPVTAKVMFF